MTRRYRRSPYLLLLWSEDRLELLHADTLKRFHVRPRMLDMLSALGHPATEDELTSAGFPIGAAALEHFHRLGLLEVDGGARPAIPWDPLELATHRLTATGGQRLDDRGPPPPVWKRVPAGPATPLPRPASSRLAPLDDVLRRRRSVRRYAPRPLALAELSDLLHHAARVEETRGDTAYRPFPTAGARSELEIYVVARDVAGLPAGAYYHDARAHHLVRVRAEDEHQTRLVRSVHDAMGAAPGPEPPAVLLVTAAFGRTSWKYRHLALSLVYKDVGALFQTLYLVATALGLAPCAVGGGDEAANSRWLGLDPLEESQVGCFVVGPAEA